MGITLDSEPQVLGYAPAQERSRARFGLALVAYSLAQAGIYSVWIAVDISLGYFRAPLAFAFLAVPLLVVLNGLGFIPSLILARPLRHRRRWLPYVTIAGIGAVTILDSWLVMWLSNELAIPTLRSRITAICFVIGGFIGVSFCISLILLLVYRAVVDRKDSQVGRIAN